MTQDRRAISQQEALWISFKKEPTQGLLHRCMDEMEPLLKSVNLNNELILQEYGGDLLLNSISGNLSQALSKAEKLLMQFKVLTGILTNTYTIRLTEEEPAMLVSELKDLRGASFKIVSQSVPGVRLMADRFLLMSVLNALLDEVTKPGNAYAVSVTTSGACTGLHLHLPDGYTRDWEENITSVFIRESLYAMGARLDLEKAFIALTFKTA